MKNKFKGIDTILILSVLFSAIDFAYAQTGIGTRNPKATLHIDGAKDNDATAPAYPTASQLANDVIVKNTGFVGVGTDSPVVKLDMRSAGTENALGLGTTTMTAAAAASGALRYDVTSTPTGSKIQWSDGSVWNKVYVPPTKALVVAKKITSQGIPYNVATTVQNWSEVQDTTNSFAPSSGIFTAPHDGIYTFLMTYNFTSTVISDGTRSEAQIYSNTAGAILGSTYKTFGQSMTGTTDDASSTRSTQAGGICTVTVQLASGAQIVPRLFQNLSNSSILLRITSNASDPTNSDDGFNTFTVIEQ